MNSTTKYCQVIFLFLLFTVGFFMAKAQYKKDSLSQKLDEDLLSAHKLNKFNGSALIVERRNIVLQKSYGYKNVESHSLNDANTIFQIGSITKQFTATVILKLQEEGKLSVNDKLSKYFPEFAYGGTITLENLLTHTSGIYNYTNDMGEEDSAIVCNAIDKQLFLDIVFKKPLDLAPG